MVISRVMVVAKSYHLNYCCSDHQSYGCSDQLCYGCSDQLIKYLLNIHGESFVTVFKCDKQNDVTKLYHTKSTVELSRVECL